MVGLYLELEWSESSRRSCFLRLFAVSFADPGKRWRQRLRNLRFHHFVESLAHLFFMCLDLAHSRYVPLRDLMVVLDVVLERLVVVILDLLLRDAAHLVVLLVGLVRIRLGLHARHAVLLRVERQF